MDCIIIGFNEQKLEDVVHGFEHMKQHSGAYQNLLHCIGKIDGRWMHYTDILNEVAGHAGDSNVNLHPMQLPNLAACFLTSYLRKRNFHVEIINFFNIEKKRLEELLLLKPRAVAITTSYYITDGPVIEIVNFLKKVNPEVKMIVGGPYISGICRVSQDTTTQDYLLEKMGADIYINSHQGERTLSKVLSALKGDDLNQLDSVPNLIFRSELQVKTVSRNDNSHVRSETTCCQFVRTPLKQENNDFNTDYIDWSFFPRSHYTPTTLLQTSRGCPFECAFCNYPLISGGLVYRNLEGIEKEMRQIKKAGGNNIVFIDDSFNVPLARFKKILRMMISNDFQFNWFSFFRCSESDDEAFDLMEESGCRGVFLGIESGDQGVLDKMNKKVKVEQYKIGIRKLHEHGIFSFVSLIVGFPGETEESVNTTIQFLEETKPTFMKAELYFHSADVPIHRKAAEVGLKGGGFGWRHKTMDWQTACEQINVIYRTVSESHICPVYMFDFWTIPYLIGKGLSLEQIKRFLSLCRPLVVNHIDTSFHEDKEWDYESLRELGKEISSTLQRSE